MGVRLIFLEVLEKSESEIFILSGLCGKFKKVAYKKVKKPWLEKWLVKSALDKSKNKRAGQKDQVQGTSIKKNAFKIIKSVTLISKNTSIKTQNPHYNHSTPLNRLKIKDLDFALDLLKILLNEHFKSDTIALLLKITYFSFHLSKTTAPLPSNHQQNHLIS